MTIIVFLIDTSASMNQRAYLGGRPTLLDVAKSAVETFVKVRQRSPESRGDRYMLLTFEDTPHNIKAGWKENLATFMNELKNLQCVGLTTLGTALKNAFDVLNINRMQTGIDTYGQGRCPFYLEPSVIVVITDGGKYTTGNGVHQDFTLPMHTPIPGSELTKEPFRWDQRLFSLVLRLSGTPAVERDTGLVASDASPIDAMCEVTGGRSYCITSHRMMMQCIDSLVQKVQSGVVINFEKIGPDPLPLANESVNSLHSENDEENEEETGGLTTNGSIAGRNAAYPNANSNSTIGSMMPNNLANSTAWHSCRRLIYVPRSAQKGFAVGFWPIPESFWPDISASSLPPRSAHPNVKFTCTSQEPLVIENLPFDKYELEPSPLTQFILARKQPTICWQVFIANSYKSSEVGHPFGYLKASTNLTCVNLFVMPYNYPVLLPLLDELFKVHRLKPSNEWRTQFTNYMRTMPAYYAASLRRALTRMGAPAALAQTLIPDNMDNTLSYSVLNYLKRLKNTAKMEFDRLCNEVISKQVANKSLANGSTNAVLEGLRVTPRATLKKDLLSNSLTDLRDELNKFSGFVVGLVKNHQQQRGAQSYRNAFDIPRKSLLDQVVRMRANFLQPGLLHTKLLDDDYVHSMPVSQMGNYQEYLKRMTPPLREIESTPVRQHMFGNPFKIDKRMMVDEADIDIVGATSSASKGLKRSLAVAEAGNLGPGGGLNSSRPPSKRKPGPIPKDVTVRRPSYSPPNTPPGSPIPWSDDIKGPTSPPLPPPPCPSILNSVSRNLTPSLNSTPTTTTTVPAAATALTPTTKMMSMTTSTNVVTAVTLSITTSSTSNSCGIASSMLMNSASTIAPTEQKLVNGDILTAGVFDPIIPIVETVNNNSNNNGGVGGSGAANHSCEATVTNNIDATMRNSANTSCGVIKTEIKNEPRVMSPSFTDGQHENNSVGQIKCTETEGCNSAAPPTMNHVDERQIKVEPKVEKEKPLTKKDLEEIRKHNLEVRNSIYKEIRRKGTNFATLFTHLQVIQGSLDTRLAFVRDIVKESLRFKRRNLANLLEEYLKKLQEESKNVVINYKMHHNGANKIT
ncbi:PREDICTED: integrator complex subunit 6-B [Ceratosolen solmsi marchali]|uniref:Integrator complex subunit 6-B n=1 Tax=Ceratosolen solmsi marchali TaxID=326594 RepID=A0AAJ7E263_9HYME|nr:PREDICTED: integrator complex subunit 6-B [Ceratosolen solmsi marchali]